MGGGGGGAGLSANRDVFWLVMERLDGPTLSERLVRPPTHLSSRAAMICELLPLPSTVPCG